MTHCMIPVYRYNLWNDKKPPRLKRRAAFYRCDCRLFQRIQSVFFFASEAGPAAASFPSRAFWLTASLASATRRFPVPPTNFHLSLAGST
jgi:hypothetical protein